MGIDAMMFVRNRGPRLDTNDLERLSAEMFAELSSPPLWRSRETQLALSFVRTLADYRAELAQCRLTYPDSAKYFEEGLDTLPYPDRLQIWEQDGPCIISAEDEQLIEVDLLARYFRRDYLRGPWRELRAIAEWLEKRFPGSEVWYGGDSSGVEAVHLTPEFKNACSQALEAVEERERQSGE